MYGGNEYNSMGFQHTVITYNLSKFNIYNLAYTYFRFTLNYEYSIR